MINELLPSPRVATAEAFDDPVDQAPLFAAEAAVVARALESRRREFGTVRSCARTALRELGFGPLPILPGERGAPRWPDGVVGSMTHCRGYRAAAVARASEVLTIGLDAEPNEPLPHDGVTELVALPEERLMLSQLASANGDVHWDRLLFSAKESVYKAWFPLTRRWLDFTDAVIRINPVAQTFSAELQVLGPEVSGAPLASFAGTWLARNGLLLTAISVETP